MINSFQWGAHCSIPDRGAEVCEFSIFPCLLVCNLLDHKPRMNFLNSFRRDAMFAV